MQLELFLLYGTAFIAILLIAEGLYFTFLGRGVGTRRNLNRRLQLIDSGASRDEVMSSLRREAWGGGLLSRLSPELLAFGQSIDRRLNQAGMRLSVEQMALIVAIGTLVLALAARLFLALGMVASLAGGLVAASAGAALIVTIRRARRLRRFGEQLPEAIDLIVRSLEAGHPINVALGLVASEMSDPIGTEFGLTVDEVTYGLSIPEALENMSARVAHADIRYVIVSIRIQHGTGGNLAEVLSNVSRVLRDRLRMFKKIKAISAEGRISAILLSCLPFFVLGGIWVFNPNYYRGVQDDPMFPMIMGAGAGLLLAGIVVMWRMVNIRV
ncbi:MAG: type II secretion system F family protein [Alphaproteobacteria bacterium]